MAADGLTLAEPTAQAARVRLQALAGDKAWFDRLMSGDAAAREEYDKLTQTLTG